MTARIAAVAVLVGLLAGIYAGTAEAANLYVSPHGSDSNPGTKARPFRTLTQARDAARDVRRPLRADVVIRIAGGTYRQQGPLRLGASDSGGNGHEVVYKAQGGAKPLISGG